MPNLKNKFPTFISSRLYHDHLPTYKCCLSIEIRVSRTRPAPCMWPPTVSGEDFSKCVQNMFYKRRPGKKKQHFHLIICIMLLLYGLVLIVGNKNQNLPRECKKLSFPPRFSLFRALRYALVGVGKKKKQTFWQCISLK